MFYGICNGSWRGMLILESLTGGIIAWVVWGVLMEPGMILYGWYLSVSRLEQSGAAWLAKPLGACGACFSGQTGFWFYILAFKGWRLSEHIAFTAQTIFFFLVIKGLSEWTRKNGYS